MQFGILGGGALGLLWGARLLAEHPVMVTRTSEQSELIQKQGLSYTARNGQKKVVPLQSVCGSVLRGQISFDLLFVTVKQKDLGDVLPWIEQHTHPESQIVFWQNGFGHHELLETLAHRPWTYLAVTTEGALKEAGNAVRHTGQGESWIGLYPGGSGPHPLMRHLISKWEKPFAVHVEKHIMGRIWEKLAINCVINPLTAIFGWTNGELLSKKDEPTWRGILNEVVYVARKEGIQLDPDALLEKVAGVCERTAANTSSMLRDIQNGTMTEIDAINGAIVRLGQRHGIPTPVNARLVSLIRAKENRVL